MITYELFYTLGHKTYSEELNAENDNSAIEQSSKLIEKFKKDIGFDGVIDFQINKIVTETIFESSM